MPSAWKQKRNKCQETNANAIPASLATNYPLVPCSLVTTPVQGACDLIWQTVPCITGGYLPLSNRVAWTNKLKATCFSILANKKGKVWSRWWILVPLGWPLAEVVKHLQKVVLFQIEMREQNGDSPGIMTFASHSISCSSPQTHLSGEAFSTGAALNEVTWQVGSSHTIFAGGNKLVGGNTIFTGQYLSSSASVLIWYVALIMVDVVPANENEGFCQSLTVVNTRSLECG